MKNITVRMKIKALFVIALLGFGCKNNTPVSTTKSDETKTDTPVVADTNIYRLVVSFYSIGNGVEGEYVRGLEDSIANYSTNISKYIDFKRSSWGREGETDFVFRLNELNSDEQSRFIEYVRNTLKGAKWVNIYEHYAYRYHPK